MRKLLIANRGEIAVRIMRAAAERGIRTVAVFSEDDADALHVRHADDARALRGTGAAAYLDGEQLVAIATACGCDAVHPGYGFLSENTAFAERVEATGLIFVGPRAETLALLGDKTQARALAQSCGVPVLAGTPGPVNALLARMFFAALPDGSAMLIKAVAGGGGRGMRLVRRIEDVAEAHARCRSEAEHAFGNGNVYVEQLMPRARHIEVQIVGDGSGRITHLGERECSIQRRHQKLVEIAPCPSLSEDVRDRLTADAVRLAETLRYRNAGTFEFLVAADGRGEEVPYAFIEANPRLQVEHTVTEAVLGVDLVGLQLELAAGRSLAELHCEQAELPAPRGFAVQVRINTETIGADGAARPSSGTLATFELPSGLGVRVDTGAAVGSRTNSNFDSLLAKLIGHSTSPRFADAVARTARALAELRIEGVQTNIPLLRRLLAHADFIANRIDTGFVDEHLADLLPPGGRRSVGAAIATSSTVRTSPRSNDIGVGAAVDSTDPLAVLHYGKGAAIDAGVSVVAGAAPTERRPPDDFDDIALDGLCALRAPTQGTIVSLAPARVSWS